MAIFKSELMVNNIFFAAFLSLGFGAVKLTGQPISYPEWEPGVLEIHHIQTGRGDASFSIFPDGTTLLVDAGDMSETHPRTTSRRNAPLAPDTSKTAPEWIVDYIDQFRPKSLPRKLDYALITHYHDDHFGEADSLRIIAVGGYQLTGIMEVGHHLPIGTILDRGFDYPINLKDPKIQQLPRFSSDAYGMISTLNEYWKFIAYQAEHNGTTNESLHVGSADQIRLKYHPQDYTEFSVRNIVSNGVVWSGYGTETFSLYEAGNYPGENPLSNGIRINYGPFNYYTGGDISGVDGLGQTNLFSVESHIAPVIGPVDVAAFNHHGNRDSQNAYYVRTLRPRVWIQQSWTADHPGSDVLRRVLSHALYPGERDIFATCTLPGGEDVLGSILEKYKSLNGHVVIRVYDRGERYKIFVLNHTSPLREPIAEFGPYESR